MIGNTELEEIEAETKIAERSIDNLDYANYK